MQTVGKMVKPADVKIALMHHPFNWFNPTEDPNLKRRLGNHFQFFLHGHEHAAWVEPLEEGLITIPAGACYGGSPKELGYNIVQWNNTKKNGKVWLRSYNSDGEGWVANLIPRKTDDTNGVWTIGNRKDPEKEKTEPEPDIPPDSPESRGVFGRRKDIDKIAESLDKVSIAAVYGMAGIGKSFVIDEVRRTPLHSTRIYVNCLINKEIGLQDLFRQLARVLGCREENPKVDFTDIMGNYNFENLKTYAEHSKPAFIHLESAHHFFDKSQYRDPGIREFL
ncbi:MAG: ATP-binding protein, partial [bacterium]|nr:ATP-binding protein [bacterium]